MAKTNTINLTQFKLFKKLAQTTNAGIRRPQYRQEDLLGFAGFEFPEEEESDEEYDEEDEYGFGPTVLTGQPSKDRTSAEPPKDAIPDLPDLSKIPDVFKPRNIPLPQTATRQEDVKPPESSKVKGLLGEYDLPPWVKDPLSAFLYAYRMDVYKLALLKQLFGGSSRVEHSSSGPPGFTVPTAPGPAVINAPPGFEYPNRPNPIGVFNVIDRPTGQLPIAIFDTPAVRRNPVSIYNAPSVVERNSGSLTSPSGAPTPSEKEAVLRSLISIFNLQPKTEVGSGVTVEDVKQALDRFEKIRRDLGNLR